MRSPWGAKNEQLNKKMVERTRLEKIERVNQLTVLEKNVIAFKTDDKKVERRPHDSLSLMQTDKYCFRRAAYSRPPSRNILSTRIFHHKGFFFYSNPRDAASNPGRGDAP